MTSKLGSKGASGKGWLERSSFNSLFEVLASQGYKIMGPVVRDGAIVFNAVTSAKALAFSVHDEQKAGSYQLVSDNSCRYFNWHHGPQALKPFLFKPEQLLWVCDSADNDLNFRSGLSEPENIAVIGVRACDLAALALQDKHFLHGEHQDPFYQKQREKMLIIAVNCSDSGEHCFCVSTHSGPEVRFYYDLLIDELADGFVLKAGSEKGLKILDELKLQDCTEVQLKLADAQRKTAAISQTRSLPAPEELMKLSQILPERYWLEAAETCLSCGNCTLVCPTCFCSKQVVVNRINENGEGIQSSHIRVWDSCFSLEHAHIFGKNFRSDTASRYRQWMIHKLVNWQTQYGRHGCVGCGRCIAWCPAGIDFLQQVHLLMEQLPENAPETQRGGV
ncbi:4Fe-4S dicluster domain-containing protein [Vibrio sp. JC009]|uniref:4Fe-4S dicluster domain-containing protein n=1 Tax=Vibrio sp. JC009 TaxID=2912314 RepID=UPI0023AF7822|nr:4Fe-4S dicluster domain-containing protein [Vibrio sp. JC009]WED24356.1 4Fe-4S dicluster domain-containing protein [Vibrio sp. JC009]